MNDENLTVIKAEPQKLLIEKSVENRRAVKFSKTEKPAKSFVPEKYLRKTKPRLAEVSEFDVVRHYTNLSRLNYSLDTHFYPLGSCTMKYNPKFYETAAAMENFTAVHPLAGDDCVQGTLEFLYNFEKLLCEITGLHSFTLQPAAGAHGEWTGVLIARAYHQARKDSARNEVLVFDSAHGTNPASANMAGLKVVAVKSGPDGRVDVNALKENLSGRTALVMLTVPNTLGLFESHILEISDAVHKAGGLMYMDGANFNAIIGMAKPSDFGIDIMHLNTHKTFATPHGGGGPGAGPVGVTKELAQFLPVPRVEKKGDKFALSLDYPQSIGRVRAFFGNVGVLLRAYCYMRQHNGETLREISENAVINANYIMKKLKSMFPAEYDEFCMHECVLKTEPQNLNGVKTMDVAKRLLDYGFYAPTIYFPLIVHEAMMIEPTETESKAELDSFISAMTAIYNEAKTNPDKVKNAPEVMPITRLDEVGAARNPNIHW